MGQDNPETRGREKWQGWEIAADKPSFTGPHKRIAHFQVRLAGRWPDDAIEIQTKERVAVTARITCWLNTTARVSLRYQDLP